MERSGQVHHSIGNNAPVSQYHLAANSNANSDDRKADGETAENKQTNTFSPAYPKDVLAECVKLSPSPAELE